MVTTGLLWAIAAGLLAPPAGAGEPGDLLAGDAAGIEAAIGQTVRVRGVVESANWTGSGKLLFINFVGTRREAFVGIVRAENRAALDQAFGGDLAKALPGKSVTLQGKITTYRGQPQIEISQADQVVLAEQAAGSQPAAVPPPAEPPPPAPPTPAEPVAAGPAGTPGVEPAAAIAATDAAALQAAVGKRVRVRGQVQRAEWGAGGALLFINFEGGFLAVARKADRAALDAAFGGDVAKALSGQAVVLSGELVLHKGAPQIVVERPDQVSLGGAPAMPAGPDIAAGGERPASLPARPLASQPTSRPFDQARADRLFNFLQAEYTKLLKSPDWITRSLAVISLARLPTPAVNDQLIDVLKADKDEVVRLVAWEGLLARAASLPTATFDAWVAATWPLAEKGAFRADLRVDLLHMMATLAPTPPAKKVWLKLFDTANALDSVDIVTLDALGACLKAWKSPDLVQALIGQMGVLNNAYRAEYVLRAAGTSQLDKAATRITTGSEEMWRTTQADYVRWWTGEKRKWAEATGPDLAARAALRSRFLASPPALDQVNLDDPKWRQDLELGPLMLKQLDVGFVVDASGSMGDVLAWLQRDVRKFLRAFARLSREPRIGITFYRDRDADCLFVTKSIWLTGNVDQLVADMGKVDAKGGGDEPEAVLDGLTECVSKNPWGSLKENVHKLVILVGDAPPKSGTVDECLALAKAGVAKGFRVHAIKVLHGQDEDDNPDRPRGKPPVRNDLSSFDRIAEAGGGVAVEAEFKGNINYIMAGDTWEKLVNMDPRFMRKWVYAQDKVRVVKPRDEKQAGEALLAAAVADAINPQFTDRITPLIRILLAYCEESVPETRWPFTAREGQKKPEYGDIDQQ